LWLHPRAEENASLSWRVLAGAWFRPWLGAVLFVLLLAAVALVIVLANSSSDDVRDDVTVTTT
jgi:hypothetical protein